VATFPLPKHSARIHVLPSVGGLWNKSRNFLIHLCRIPVLVNGLTSIDVSARNIYHKPKSSSKQNKEHRIIIIGDSHARGAASIVKHNLNDNYRSTGFVRPGSNTDTLISSMTEDIKHLTNDYLIVFCGGANDVSKNNSKDGLKHLNNFVKVNSHTNIILMCVPH